MSRSIYLSDYLIGLKVSLSIQIGHKLFKIRPDDRFIVAHPRSGSTWLRTILANILDPGANSNPDIFNSMIPGISIRKVLFRISDIDSPRLIMSHTDYRPEIPTAVFLVRDGRDVLVSYYHYLITRRKRSLSFSNFFSIYLSGHYGHLWHRNVLSWLKTGAKDMGTRLKVIRFEDLRSDTFGVVKDVIQFLGISSSNERIVEAIKLAGLEHMRKIEIKRRGSVASSNMSFYRSGETGQWREYFTHSIEREFDECSSDAMRLAGYDL